MAELQIVAGREEHKYYPFTGIYYANRHSFWGAGQDSFTLPPAQNPDLFQALTNVEPVLQGVLQRRRGYTLFSNTYTGNTFGHSYNFRSDTLGLRRTVWASATTVIATDEQGNNVLNPIFTPATGAFAPRMVLSRDYGYFADGVTSDYKKWNGIAGTLNLTNWGFGAGSGVAANSFSNYVGAGSNVSAGAGGPSWGTPTNVQGAPDGSFATLNFTPTGNPITSDYLQGISYGFAIPGTAGTITGIQVSIKGLQNNAGGSNLLGNVSLLKGGTRYEYKNITLPGSNGIIAVGGPGDLWGGTWLLTDINASNFGVQIQYQNLNGLGAPSVSVDSAQITIFTSGSGITFTTNTSTTNVVLLNGRTYFYAFQNNNTGHTGPLSVASASTGPLVGNQVNLTGIPVSTDAQVTTVLLLATADGNDQTTLYQLGTVPNGTTTFNDTIADSVLITQPLYLNTDAAGVIHGVANNNPPPAINFPTKHKGRIYGAVGRALFFSKNLDEVTTANGLITSKWEEAWPATNQFDISEQAETIQGLLSDGETLWIATERAIRRLIGDSPSNFQKPEVQFNEVGLVTQDCWKVVFVEGQPVGTMWLTPDFRVIGSDFNTYLDVGTPIQDVLNTINTAAVGTIHANYVNKGPADYYMLYIPTGSSTNPNTVCVFNLRSKKWFIWQPTDSISTSLFLIDGSGFPRWLFGAATGSLYEWTQGTFQDRINNTPVSYPVTMQTSWLDLGDYNLRKFVNQIVPTTADQTALTVAVDAASNELDFNTPLSVVPATAVTPAAIPTDVFVPLASGPSHSRAFRFTFVSPASTIQNVLTGFSIETGSFHRYVWWLFLGGSLLHIFEHTFKGLI
jgi:hypothetical protein